MSIKSFKDPIYGYIEIDSKLVKDVIDKPAFQRLRHIVQTSYEPLYPSATHNRFVHSLGVYHLGNYVAEIIQKHSFENLKRIKENTSCYTHLLDVFRIACLLHDVGHAPFSHTGEGFYVPHVENGGNEKLHKRIADLCGDATFLDEMLRTRKIAAPHELMSIIIALTTFQSCFNNDFEKTFFARAVAGYHFPKSTQCEDGIDTSFVNCLISLLNSSPVDVDRLDYLIRDALETGFKTVTIDYQRLLGGVRIIDYKGKCEVAFTKRAVSVLENVVYAHDAERKWVQSHPAIVYETQLLKEAFASINTTFSQDLEGNTIFCEDALRGEGVTLADSPNLIKISYLCDADILFLLKNIDNSSAKQYMDRSARYLPLWKSETEFFALFGQGWDEHHLDRLMTVLNALVGALQKGGNIEIDNKTLDALKDEAVRAKNEVRKSSEEKGANETLDKAFIYAQKELFYELVEALKLFANKKSMPFKFRIFNTKSFTSGFIKNNLSDLLIELHPKDSVIPFGMITRVLGNRPENENLPKQIYYIFCEEISEDFKNDKPKLSECLVDDLKEFVKKHAEAIDKAFSKEDGKKKANVGGTEALSVEKEKSTLVVSVEKGGP